MILVGIAPGRAESTQEPGGGERRAAATWVLLDAQEALLRLENDVVPAVPRRGIITMRHVSENQQSHGGLLLPGSVATGKNVQLVTTITTDFRHNSCPL